MTDLGLLAIGLGLWWAGQAIGSGLEDIAEAIRDAFEPERNEPELTQHKD